ncbi:MAG TPA: DndE family protein [Abditibacteriaceae bacterium]|jgi:hypothetical protein
MKFKPSLAAEEFIESIHARLGARNKAVLGRSALFLAIGEGVPDGFKSADSSGKDLDDETVIGDDLRDVVRAALNYRAGRALDESGYRQSFRQHFEYGCYRLKQIWEDSGNDQVHFVNALLQLDGHSSGAGWKPNRAMPMGVTTSQPLVESEVKLKLLTEADEWSMNGAGTKNGLLVISGEPGSGKSQLALDLLAQLATNGVRFLFFDLKGELEAADNDEQKAANRAQFFKQTDAQYLRLIDNPLPINPLYIGKSSPETANIASRVASLVRSFGPQMGQVQEDAIRQAYRTLQKPDFASLLEALQASGATGVATSVLSKLVELNIFARAQNAVPFEDWIRRSIVIDFKPLDNDTRALAVAFILNFFAERLNQNLSVRNNIQPLQMVLFVDEAHNILPKDNKAKMLEKLAREGRSWGFPLWLASQDADKFLSAGADFAELASAGIHFSPHTLNATEQKKILGGTITKQLEKAEAALRLSGTLQTGPARQFWRDGGK